MVQDLVVGRTADLLSPGVRELGLLARIIRPDDAEGTRAYEELRWGFFVKEKGWVDEDPARPHRERDRYDAHCRHLGVFQEERLVAYLRALPWKEGVGFMLEREFRPLLGGEDLKREGAVEISRLVLARDSTSFLERKCRLAVLLKLLYRLSLKEGYRRFYVTVEPSWLCAFQRVFPFPFEPLGVPHTFPDGTQTVAACADLAQMEERVRTGRPEEFEWFRRP